jgi:hypothetical protein
MSQISVPDKDVALFGQKRLHASTFSRLGDKVSAPGLVESRAVDRCIPVLSSKSEAELRIAVTARRIHEFARAGSDILKGDPARRKFHGPIHDNVCRVLMSCRKLISGGDVNSSRASPATA